MNDNKAIIEKEEIKLANWGDRKEVRELAERLKMMMPGGQKYTADEALTLAQISVAHDLDPFNGEVWLIKDDTSGKVFGALIGIKGHRKHAKKQATYWGEFVRVIDPSQYNAPDGSIVFEYHIYDDTTLGAHQLLLEKYIKSGMSLKEVLDMIGRPPHTLGIGIWSPGDKTKMKPAQCAMFRAEKDALKRRFDVKFRVEINGQTLPMNYAEDDEEISSEEIEAEYETSEPVDDDTFLEELGYETKEKSTAQGQLDMLIPSATMSLETASNVIGEDGKKYGDLDSRTLSFKASALEKKIRLPDIPPDDREKAQYKYDAIAIILQSRK